MNKLKNNHGFSLIELIVVIAIMAIITTAMAPMLIRYINKARLSDDIDTGKAIVTAISSVIADDGDFQDAVVSHDTPYPVNSMDKDAFKNEVFKVLGVSGTIKGKSKKDVNGGPLDMEFYYTVDPEKNKVMVYYGGTGDDYQIYPTLGSKLKDKSN